MPKISEITEDTDPKTFLDVGKITETLNGIDLKTFTAETVDVLGRHMNSGGGLDEYSLNVGGQPILYEKTQKTILELQQVFDSLEEQKEAIIRAAEDHRKEELSTIYSKLETKIAALESEKSQYEAALNGTSNVPSQYQSYVADTSGMNATQIQNEIDSLEGILETYRARKTTVEQDEYFRG